MHRFEPRIMPRIYTYAQQADLFSCEPYRAYILRCLRAFRGARRHLESFAFFELLHHDGPVAIEWSCSDLTAAADRFR